MTRYVLAGKFGRTEPLPAQTEDDARLASFDLLNGERTLRFGLSRTIASLARMNVFATEVGVDLLLLAAHVHAADTRLNRRQTAQDGWTREIGILVPVSDERLWAPATQVLQTMLRFLTGDLWQVSFRTRPEAFAHLAPSPLDVMTPHGFDGISLFSGGLDSLIGAIDILNRGGHPLFVSHSGEGAVSSPQRQLFDRLCAYDKAKRPEQPEVKRLRAAIAFPRTLVDGIGGENSTRGRSFLFLSLAALAGTGLGTPFSLAVPENGLIALNVPLDPTRPGSNSTHTTHPFYLDKWNELLRILGIPGTVRHPYWNRTKGQMAAECSDVEFLEDVLPLSVSCAHPSAGRYQGGGAAHCGTCVPCLIRRAAIGHAFGRGNDRTGYRCEDMTAEPLNAGKASGLQVRGFQYAVRRLEERPELASLLIRKVGPLPEAQGDAGGWANVYKRGIEEVGDLLRGVRTRSPADQEL